MAELLSNEETGEWAYPKMLIARTRHEATDQEGVRIVDIARWLTAESFL